MLKKQWAKKQFAMILILIFAMLGCAGNDKSVYTSQHSIIPELEAQARQINSYGQEYRIRGLCNGRVTIMFTSLFHLSMIVLYFLKLC